MVGHRTPKGKKNKNTLKPLLQELKSKHHLFMSSFFFFFFFFFLLFSSFSSSLCCFCSCFLCFSIWHTTSPQRNRQKGDHLEEHKNPVLPKESAAPDTVFLSEPARAPGRANPKKGRKRYLILRVCNWTPSRALFSGFSSSSAFAFRATFSQASTGGNQLCKIYGQ